MKNLKTIAHLAVIILAALAFGFVVWFFASRFYSLNAQVNQNTQNTQEIIQFLNSKTSAATPSAQ
jgi:hypothetical protein